MDEKNGRLRSIKHHYKKENGTTFGHNGSSCRPLSEGGFPTKFTYLLIAPHKLTFSHMMNLCNDRIAATLPNELLFTRDDLKSVNWPGLRSGNAEYR